MGKSNRIRANRAAGKAKTLNVKKQKKGMPSWAMTLITLVVAAAILLSVAFSLLAANGVFNRMRTSMSSENYKVNTNMMSYYFYNQYQSFYNNYSSYIDYFSLNSELSLKEQPFGGDGSSTYYDTMLLGEFSGTWFDYFMDQTVKSVKTVLIYCEEADVRGITLNEDEMKQIDDSIASIAASASSSGYTMTAYLTYMYGPGVKETDVRKAMEYSALASKCMNAITEELSAAISADRINAEYAANVLDYNMIDYITYSFEVDYDTIAKDVLGSDYTDTELKEKEADVLAKYREAVTEAQVKADALKAITDPTEFTKYLLNHAATENFDDIYATQTVADADKPSDDDFNAIKTAMINKIVEEVMGDVTDASDAATKGEENATAYEKTVTNTYADILNTVKDKVFTAVSTAKDEAVMKKMTYVSETDAFSVWAFAAERAANDTNLITEGDIAEKAADAELSNSKGYSYFNVYMLTATQAPNKEPTRNVAYILFDSEAAATAAIADLQAKGALTHDIFEEYAESADAVGHTHLENYTEGLLGSTVFDEWLFKDTTVVGTLTATPLKIEEGSFAVALYYGEGEENWYVSAKDNLLSDDYGAYYTELEAKFPVTVKENALKKVEA